MATSMEDDFKFTLEVHFAQRLAGNAPKARERTVKKLKRWIAARSTKQGDVGMEEELLRLWKGLFYCMWMCDKPLVQEELADKIADLIHSFSTPLGAMDFFDAFLLTMKREWLGIDRLRMDKFFMFIRRCFRQTLVVLRNNNWEDSVVDRFLDVLRKTPLCGNAEASSDGLCYHFIDIYREEVALCAGQELTPEQVFKLIDPFCVLVTTAHSKTLLKVTLRGFFQEIIDESDVGYLEDSEDEGIDSGEDEKGDGKPDEEEDKDDDDDKIEKLRKPVRKEMPKLKYNYEAIANRLFALASKKSTPGPYRRKVYAMVKKFRDLKEGVFPDYNVASLLNYQDDEEEFIYGDRPWLKKNLGKNKGGQQGQKRKAPKEVAGGGDEEGDGEPRRKRRRRRKKKQIGKSAPGEDKETTDVEAGETSPTSTKKEEGNVAAEDADTKASAGEEVTDKKKRKAKKRKSDGNQIDQEDSQKMTDGEDSKMAVSDIKTSCETDGNDSEVSTEKPSKKLKKRRSKVLKLETIDKKQSDESNKTPEKNQVKTEKVEPNKTPEKSQEKTEKVEAAEVELQVNLTSEKSQSKKIGGQRKTEKPFAAFHRTSTPPAAFVRKAARKDGEPQTEPPRRKGILLSDDVDSDQATPKKRVKIALGLNKAHASKDYQRQLQESPGIPFDGSKQPTQSVLKTPSPKHRQATGKKPNTSTFQTPSPKVGKKKSPSPATRKQSPKSSSPGGHVKKSPKEKIIALRRSLRITRTKKQK